MKDNLGKVIGILFMARTFAHTAHLKTESFAAHKALDDFYSDLPDLTDKLAEVAQGSVGLLDIPVVETIGDINSPLEGLKEQLKQMEQLMQEVQVGYIINIFEEIQAHYASTFYKLTFLK